MNRHYLIVFVKNLIPGKVKNRLAKHIGIDSAMDVYKALLDYTAEVTDKITCDKGVFYSEYVEVYDAWIGENHEKYVQKGNGLGERMLNAFTRTFEKGYDKAVIIGSDSLEITSAHIEEAFRALDGHDVVVGPAYDGGYYLLGLKNIFPALFEDKTYSHEHVLEEAIEEIQSFGMSYCLLEELHDVDTMEDLKRSGYEIIEEDKDTDKGEFDDFNSAQ